MFSLRTGSRRERLTYSRKVIHKTIVHVSVISVCKEQIRVRGEHLKMDTIVDLVFFVKFTFFFLNIFPL